MGVCVCVCVCTSGYGTAPFRPTLPLSTGVREREGGRRGGGPSLGRILYAASISTVNDPLLPPTPDRRCLPSSPSLYGCMYIEIGIVQYTRQGKRDTTAAAMATATATGTALSIVCISGTRKWSTLKRAVVPCYPLQAPQPPDHGRSLPAKSCYPHRPLIHPQDSASGSHQTTTPPPPPHLPYHFIQVPLALQPYRPVV